MPNLDGIVTLINNALAAGNFSTRKFQPSAYYQIVDDVKTTGADDEKIEPMIVFTNGECKKMVYDDTNAFQIFHKLNDVSYSLGDLDYGPPGTTMQETASMELIFVGNRKRLQVRPEDVAAAIMMDMPKEFTAAIAQTLMLNTCIISTDEVETDPYKVWAENWQGTKSFVKPETILVSVKYKIIDEYNRKCWSLCPTPSMYNY
jgi:hypothetical protein